MYVLIAPNAFKNSLSAPRVADSIAEGLLASALKGRISVRPVGDGGDGTAELLRAHLRGTKIAATVHDPLGRWIKSHWVLLGNGRTAVVELADASGLRLLAADELDPLRATSFGTGELIKHALDVGVNEVILCAGGSATVDGGTGLLQALGVVFRDSAGIALTALPGSLVALASIDLSGLDRRIADCKFTVLCDVANPLLGERGAAAIFGPQKGATPAAVLTLEAALEQLSRTVREQTGREMAGLDRGGAAGGVAAGLSGVLGADLVSGTDYFLSRTEFDEALKDVDLVITGEGRIDEQTAEGKAPWGVALRAKSRGAFVVGLAGQVPLKPSAALGAGFDALIPIGHCCMNAADAISATAENLRR